MNTIVFLAVYLAFGFFFMTVCAKFGWMDRYDPALMYWIAWPVILFMWMFKLAVYVIDIIQTPIEIYVDNLKPKTDESAQ